MALTERMRLAIGTGATALTLAACAPSPQPIATEQTRPVEQAGSKYFGELVPLLTPHSESELWDNINAMYVLSNQMYCDSFPGCVPSNAPPFKILDQEQYVLQTQQDDPNHTPINPSELVGSGFNTTRSGEILMNKDLGKLQDAIRAGYFPGIAQEMPTMLIHERFHADKVSVPISIWEVNTGDGTVVSFDIIDGLGLVDTKQSIQFALLEEAAAVVISKEVQKRQLGTVLGQDMTTYIYYAQLLERKMSENKVSADTLIAMHRTSSLDDFLALIYPQEADIVARRVSMIEEFNQVGARP